MFLYVCNESLSQTRIIPWAYLSLPSFGLNSSAEGFFSFLKTQIAIHIFYRKTIANLFITELCCG